MRCLDAQTGDLLWEAPYRITKLESPFPPIVADGLAIYASVPVIMQLREARSRSRFGYTGGTQREKVMSWIYSNDNPYYPRDHRPRLWAWDLEQGSRLGKGLFGIWTWW